MSSEVVEGVKKLKLGALLAVASSILGLILLAASLVVALTAPKPGAAIAPMLGLVAVGSIAALGLIVVIVALISFILWFMATGHFKRYDAAKLGIGRAGMVLQLAGIVILLCTLISLAVYLASISPGTPKAMIGAVGAITAAALIGGVLILVGGILFAIMLMRLPEKQLDTLFKYAGMLYIAAIILSLIPYINIVGSVLAIASAIIIYVASKNSLQTLQT